MFLLALLIVCAFGSRREERLADVLMELLKEEELSDNFCLTNSMCGSYGTCVDNHCSWTEEEEEVSDCDFASLATSSLSKNAGLVSCDKCNFLGCEQGHGVCPGGAEYDTKFSYVGHFITKCHAPGAGANTGTCIYKEGSDPNFHIGSRDNHNADCAVANGNEALCMKNSRATFCTWTGKVTITARVQLKAADVMKSCSAFGNLCADKTLGSSGDRFSMYGRQAGSCNRMCTPFLASGKYYGGRGPCTGTGGMGGHDYLQEVTAHKYRAVYSRSACFELSEKHDTVSSVEWRPYTNQCHVFTGALKKTGGGTGAVGNGQTECYQRCSYSDQRLAKAGEAGQRWVGCRL